MATWRDGAAYAPETRPDGFATPAVAPLPEGEPYRAATPGAVDRPQDLVGAAQPPLDALGEAAPSTRDPRDAFEVTSATLTAPTAPDGARDPRQPFANYSPATSPDAPPSGPPISGPPPPHPPMSGPPPSGPTQGPPPSDSPWPYPPPVGSPGPGTQLVPAPRRGAPPSGPMQNYPPPQVPIPYQGPPTPAVTPAQRRLVRVAGALSLGGFLFTFAAPFLLIAAGALALRARRITGWTGILALSLGWMLIFVQWISQELGEPSLLAGSVALGFAFAFFIAAAKRA